MEETVKCNRCHVEFPMHGGHDCIKSDEQPQPAPSGSRPGSVLSPGDRVQSLVRPTFLPVLEMAEQYRYQWRTRNEEYWLARLMEEVGELAASTAGDHEDPPEHELRQIASICLNWLDRFYA